MKLRISIGLVAAVLALPLALRADTLPTAADSQLNVTATLAKGGALTTLTVKNSLPGGGFRGLVQFDLQALPPGTTIEKATLRAWVNYVLKEGTVDVAAVLSPWSEATVNQATAPSLAAQPSATFAVSKANLKNYVSADVTDLVQDWLSGALANNGVALIGGADDVFAKFDSKENTLSGHGVELEVIVSSSGAQGPQGLQGPQGPQGLQGPQGDQGLPGAQGAQGLQGPQGDQGLPGAQGAQGLQGPQGDQGLPGAQGLQGPQGDQGLPGAQGLQGPQGDQGLPGAQGLQGPQGDQGLPGAQGLQGPQGDQGLPGAQGLQGPQGDQGLPGAQGAQGLQGPQGDQGLPGAQGAQGLQGPQGDQGLPGAQGAQGLQGPQGDQGLPGAQGAQGLQGPQGDQGLPGAQGAQGLQGPQGDQGLPGAQGAQGLQGPQGDQGLPGAPGAQGLQGSQGDQGLPGAQGAQGLQGSQGDQGPTGIVSTGFGAGLGANGGGVLDNTLEFVGPSVDVTVASTQQKVIVVANKALGSTAVGGASGLNLWVCSRSTVPGAPLAFVGPGILGLTVPQDQRHHFGLSAVITNLTAGTYSVGLCGAATSGASNWNFNEYGYVTAFVAN